MFSVSKRPTIREIHDLYQQEKAVPSQVFQFFLNRSKQIDKKIHSVQTFTEQKGMEDALNCDNILQEYKDKNVSDWFDLLINDYPLFGVPYSLKSIIQAEGGEFTASSKILNGFISPYSSTVHLKVKEAGGILVAINHHDEFAMGSSGENSAFAKTRNPFETERVPGGSSSGSAAAVSSGQVVFSLATDTGGSIRQPASFTDTVGFKPTYGMVSRSGVMPMASSLDQVGPLANSVKDALLVTYVISGQDSYDQQSVDTESLRRQLLDQSRVKTNRIQKKITVTNNPLKIGIPKEFYMEGDVLHPQIRRAMLDIQSKLGSIGHELVQVSLPSVKYAIAVYYMIMSVEVASNLERYDGIRYRGINESNSAESMYFDYRFTHFGDEPKRRILLGTYASSAGYYDAYYNKAAKVREVARREFNDVFRHVNVLLTPTTPEFPFLLGSKTNDPLKMYLSDIMTAVVNPIRIPGLTIPLGFFDVAVDEQGEILNQASNNLSNQLNVETNEEENSFTTDQITHFIKEIIKLPTGCQILGPEFSEDILFSLGEEIEMLIKND